MTSYNNIIRACRSTLCVCGGGGSLWPQVPDYTDNPAYLYRRCHREPGMVNPPSNFMSGGGGDSFSTLLSYSL